MDKIQVEQLKNQEYFSWINNNFFGDLTENFNPTKFENLEKSFKYKFKIPETDIKKIISKWQNEYIIYSTWINNFDSFLKYAENYEQKIKASDAKFTMESVEKLTNYIMQADNNLIEKSKRYFCLNYMCDNYQDIYKYDKSLDDKLKPVDEQARVLLKNNVLELDRLYREVFEVAA